MTEPRSRVFVPHQPTGVDSYSGRVVPSMDLSPAEQFGRLVFLLPENENPLTHTSAALRRIRHGLADAQFRASDYLLLVGSPILISLTAIAASERVGALRLLQWSRGRREYTPVDVQLKPLDLIPGSGKLRELSPDD